MEEKRGKSKLLLIAIIAALVLWVGFMTTGIINRNINVEERALGSWERLYQAETDEGKNAFTDEFRNLYIEEYKKDYVESRKTDLIITGIGLAVLAIPTLLVVFGERKNKRKMILAAGIVYIFTVVGIPSAVMCFIANARMKKQEAK